MPLCPEYFLSLGFVEALLISSPSLYFSVMDSRGFIDFFQRGNDYIGDRIIGYEELDTGAKVVCISCNIAVGMVTYPTGR